MKTSQDEWRNLIEPQNDDMESSRPNEGEDSCRTPRRSWPILLLTSVGVGLAVTGFVAWIGDESLRRSVTLGVWGFLTCFGGMTATTESRCGGCCLLRRFRGRGAQSGELTEHNA